jgi:hypothetical protein
MKKAIFCDVMPCGSSKNQCFGIVFIIGVTRNGNQGTTLLWLLVTANIVPSLPILVTLMMETLCSSETSALTRATWR